MNLRTIGMLFCRRVLVKYYVELCWFWFLMMTELPKIVQMMPMGQEDPRKLYGFHSFWCGLVVSLFVAAVNLL